MIDPRTVTVVERSRFENMSRGYSAVVLTALLAVAGYTAMQFIGVRDSVTRIEASLPPTLNSIDRRLSSLESREDEQDSRINEALDATGDGKAKR